MAVNRTLLAGRSYGRLSCSGSLVLAPVATEALKRIAELYQIEAEIRGKSADARCDSGRPSRSPKR
jgi:hypothetical protein